MRKLKIGKAQIIASIMTIVLAFVCAGVGLYGLSSRSSESGEAILSNMRLQAILNTAGTGAIDAYVEAAKAEKTAEIRANGGGLAEIREAAAIVTEEARAFAEEQGMGSVDLSQVDTAPPLHISIDYL